MSEVTALDWGKKKKKLEGWRRRRVGRWVVDRREVVEVCWVPLLASSSGLVGLYDYSSLVLTWNLGTTVDAQELLAYCAKAATAVLLLASEC